MKNKIPLADAEIIAKEVVKVLSPHCRRIEIAGSIRRKKPDVGDIEIVAIPNMLPSIDMFGNSGTPVSELDVFNFNTELGRLIKKGSKYKQIELFSGLALDLFIVLPPAQWGVIFMIRTGSWEYSKHMVTTKKAGGVLPSNCKVKDGGVYRDDLLIGMDEEIDYYNLCGLEFVPPEFRSWQ
jgi:DNA polymerase/3'-5' exonuclease PolX